MEKIFQGIEKLNQVKTKVQNTKLNLNWVSKVDYYVSNEVAQNKDPPAPVKEK